MLATVPARRGRLCASEVSAVFWGRRIPEATYVHSRTDERAAHVITLDDPIEYRFAARRCLIHQRELGTHIPSFATGLRAALREAPDVILLGELRDRDTIAAALTAAETGHLVLATLHAPAPRARSIA